MHIEMCIFITQGHLFDKHMGIVFLCELLTQWQVSNCVKFASYDKILCAMLVHT